MFIRLILAVLLSAGGLCTVEANARRATWVDHSLPPEIDHETFVAQDAIYRSLGPLLRKPVREAVTYTVGSREEFWTYSVDSWQQITAECRVVTPKAYVFVAVEDNYGSPILWNGSEGYITNQDVLNLADEFTDIHDSVTRVFGRDPDTGINGDVRLTLLMLDIDDSFARSDVGGVYTAGYFSPLDTWTEGRAALYGYHSNERKMIYIDTYPAIERSDVPDINHEIAEAYPVVAHEMTHLVHYYHDPAEDVWFDEGCASLGEYVCGYGLREPVTFSLDSNDPLLSWDESLTDYEQVALFLLYLYEHYGGDSVIRTLVGDARPSVESIDAWLAEHSHYERFYDIFDTWTVANYLDDTGIYGGRYGYVGIDLSTTPFVPATEYSSYHIYNTIYVEAGAGVYTRLTNGFALNLHCEHGRDLPSTAIVLGDTDTDFVTVGSAGAGIGSFADPDTEVVLVTTAHEHSALVTYYTSPFDPGEPNNTPATAAFVNLSDGYWQSGDRYLYEDGDQDWYAFQTGESTLATVRCMVTSGIDARLRLQFGDSLLVVRDDEYSGDDELIEDFPLESSGTYLIGVGTWETMEKRAAGASTGGSYSLEITLYGQAQAEEPITLGTPVAGDVAVTENGRIVGVTGTEGGTVTCWDTNGEMQWEATVENTLSPPVVNKYGMTYVSTVDGLLYAFDESGDRLWTYNAENACTGTPAVDGNGVIYIPADGSVHAVGPGGDPLWTYTAENVRFTAPAVSVDSTIFCGGDNGGIYAVTSDGIPSWRYEASGAIVTGVALDDDGRIYAGTDSGGIYVLNSNGTLNWKYHTIGAITCCPVISGDKRVYAASRDGRSIHAFTTDGAMLWTYETENTLSSPIVLCGEGIIAFGLTGGTVLGLGPDGSMAWKYTGQSTVAASLVDRGENGLRIVSSDGVMYGLTADCGEGAPHPWPTLGQNNRRTGSPESSFVNAQPEITIQSLPPVIPYVPYFVPVAVTDPDTLRGDRAALSLANGPDWLTIDGLGWLRGVYEGDVAGADDIELVATDLIGAADTLAATIVHAEPLAPPENLYAEDVPGDQGYNIALNWDNSPDAASGDVTHYVVYRSRVPEWGEVMPQSWFHSLDALLAWEQTSTVLVDSVTVGETSYTATVPLNGVAYYFWVQAVGEQSASKPAGSFLETMVAKQPGALTVGQPSPNPFNAATTIRFTLPSLRKVACTVYTVTGQVAARPVDRMMAAGTHNIRISGDGLSSGMYLVGLSIGERAYTFKVTHVK